MPRIARLVVKEEEVVYHVMSRTALDGYVLGDVEKDFLLHNIKWLAKVYFTEILGFCIMGNHFHLLLRMGTGRDKSSEEIVKRFKFYYGEEVKRELSEKRNGDRQIIVDKPKWWLQCRRGALVKK